MIQQRITSSRRPWTTRPIDKSFLINDLIISRNLFNVQTLEYTNTTVCSTDLDPTGNFLVIGLSNGMIELQGITEYHFGNLDKIASFSLDSLNGAHQNIHRVQWNSGNEQFLSILDNQNLYLFDPNEMREIEKYNFGLRTTWSDWSPNDQRLIAVCGSESQLRLVDIRTGSSAETVILEAKSRLASHRPTRCLWSKQDFNCLFIGDNEGYIHVYDTRHTVKPVLLTGDKAQQISGMSFTTNQTSILTTQGAENNLVEWEFSSSHLLPLSKKFRLQTSIPKRKHATRSSSGGARLRETFVPIPVNTYLRCQFYVTDAHVFCPASPLVTKSKELFIYDIKTGDKIKTLRSEDIMSQGVYTVTGLLPESLVLYVGGRGRLRAWSLDEDHQRKMEEEINRYHKTSWESDEEL